MKVYKMNEKYKNNPLYEREKLTENEIADAQFYIRKLEEIADKYDMMLPELVSEI